MRNVSKLTFAFLLSLATSSALRAENSLARVMELLGQDKRVEGFKMAEEIFAQPGANTALRARTALLLTTAFEGETQKSPGYYADVLLSLDPMAQPKQRFRWLRLSGDYYLSRNDLKIAEEKYQELAKSPEGEDKDFAQYKLSWIDINRGQSSVAVEKLMTLIGQQKDSRLAAAASHDLGRFWAEMKPDARPTAAQVFAVLKAEKSRIESFYRGLQKSLFYPKRPAERSALRAEVARLPDFELLVENDLSLTGLGTDLSCEKLEWAQHLRDQSTLNFSKVKNVLLLCLQEDDAKTKKKNAAYVEKILARSQTTEPTEKILRSKLYALNLNYEAACRDGLDTLAQRESGDLLEARSFCEEAYKINAQLKYPWKEMSALLYRLNPPDTLGLVHELYRHQPDDFDAEVRRKEFAAKFRGTPVTALVFEEAKTLKRTATMDFMAQNLLSGDGANSGLLANYILTNDGAKEAENFQMLQKKFPLGKSLKDPATQTALPVWLAAYGKFKGQKEDSFAALKPLCAELAEAPKASQRDFWIYCSDKLSATVLWQTATQFKLSCDETSLVWARLVDDVPEKEFASTHQFSSILKNVAIAQYATAHKELKKICPAQKKHALGDELALSQSSADLAQQKTLKKDVGNMLKNFERNKKQYTTVKSRATWSSQKLKQATHASLRNSLQKLKVQVDEVLAQPDSAPLTERLTKLKELLSSWEATL